MIKLKSFFRRGQGPSGSKNSGHQQQSGQIKQSASVSSLDAVGLKSSKSAKHFGSKDKLVDQGLKNSKDKLSSRGGSRERLADSLPVGGGEIPTSGLLITNSKPKKKTSLQSSQMPIIQQNVIANNNLIDHRDVVDYNNLATNEKRDLGDLSAAVTFDGQKEVSNWIYLFIFYFHVFYVKNSVEDPNSMIQINRILQKKNPSREVDY